MQQIRRLASFLASPSGALVAVGFALMALAAALSSTLLTMACALLGATLIVIGLGRRFVRAEDRWRALHRGQRSVEADLARQSEDLVAIRRQISDAADDARSVTSQSIGAVAEDLTESMGAMRVDIQALTVTATELAGRVAKIERRKARADSTSTASTNVTIGDIRLTVLSGNTDAQWYTRRGVFEERRSLLYTMIRNAGFTTFVDVGANYGFVSIVAHRAAPEIRIVAVEADERLIPLIKTNLATNGVADAEVIHAIAGAQSGDARFSLNPSTTLDNRVTMEGWTEQSVRQVTLDEIVGDPVSAGSVFIKIDTQGFESKVISGATRLLSERDDWMIKMEFGPLWLRSQAVDPISFLASLCDRFQVAEFPARVPYFSGPLESLFATPIDPDRIEPFIEYVEALNREGKGWVDLLVRPTPKRS